MMRNFVEKNLSHAGDTKIHNLYSVNTRNHFRTYFRYITMKLGKKNHDWY